MRSPTREDTGQSPYQKVLNRHWVARDPQPSSPGGDGGVRGGEDRGMRTLPVGGTTAS